MPFQFQFVDFELPILEQFPALALWREEVWLPAAAEAEANGQTSRIFWTRKRSQTAEEGHFRIYALRRVLLPFQQQQKENVLPLANI